VPTYCTIICAKALAAGRKAVSRCVLVKPISRMTVLFKLCENWWTFWLIPRNKDTLAYTKRNAALDKAGEAKVTISDFRTHPFNQICNNFYTNNSVVGLILLMRRGCIVDGLEQPGIVNLAVDVQDFHGIHIPRINAEVGCTTVWILFFKWPPIAPTFRQRISANSLRSTNDEPIETYTHPQFSQKLNDFSLSPQTY
jgi:hypothetical protein